MNCNQYNYTEYLCGKMSLYWYFKIREMGLDLILYSHVLVLMRLSRLISFLFFLVEFPPWFNWRSLDGKVVNSVCSIFSSSIIRTLHVKVKEKSLQSLVLAVWIFEFFFYFFAFLQKWISFIDSNFWPYVIIGKRKEKMLRKFTLTFFRRFTSL